MWVNEASAGDVVIIRNSFQVGRGGQGRIMSVCTHCGDWFVMTLRRMKRNSNVVRNVPQCVPCRGRYRTRGAKRATAAMARAALGGKP